MPSTQRFRKPPNPRGNKIRDYLRLIGAKKLSRTYSERMESAQSYIGSARPTARKSHRERYGKLFIASFPNTRVGKRNRIGLQLSPSRWESRLSIALAGTDYTNSLSPSAPKMEAKLGFAKDRIFVEAIQGNQDFPMPVSELNAELGMPWPNFLLRQIEIHARALGFREVIIHHPSTSPYFSRLINLPDLDEAESEQVARRMGELKRGQQTKKTDFSKYELESLKANHITTDDIREGLSTSNMNILRRLLIEEKQKDKLRLQIEQFYSIIAKKNGYAKKGKLFVKKL